MRSGAAGALGRLGAGAATPEVLARLVALVQDADDEVRSCAAYALGSVGAGAATPEVLVQMILMVKGGGERIGAQLAWSCGKAGDKLDEESLASLVEFWRKRLTWKRVGVYCGERQSLASAAYKQLKHLAGYMGQERLKAKG